MMAEQVEPDSFEPLHHKLKQNVEAKHEALLKEYVSQFAQDEMSIGTTPLGTSEPVSQKKPYLIVMKHYQWVNDEIQSYLQQRSNEEAGLVGQSSS